MRWRFWSESAHAEGAGARTRLRLSLDADFRSPSVCRLPPCVLEIYSLSAYVCSYARCRTLASLPSAWRVPKSRRLASLRACTRILVLAFARSHECVQRSQA
eukprot:6183248-Pleurochrysis_carterae.AAC.2